MCLRTVQTLRPGMVQALKKKGLDRMKGVGVTFLPHPEIPRAARWRMTLSKAVELFLQEVRVSKAKATAAAYYSDLHRLIALSWMVLAFTPDLVRLYFTTESQRGNGMSTLHRSWRRSGSSPGGACGINSGLPTRHSTSPRSNARSTCPGRLPTRRPRGCLP